VVEHCRSHLIGRIIKVTFERAVLRAGLAGAFAQSE
jgi:hypothetical protein